MSTTPLTSGATADAAGVPTVPTRFEVTTLPVSDIDRAKAFYQRIVSTSTSSPLRARAAYS